VEVVQVRGSARPPNRPAAMEKRKRVLELRDRLDRTLAMPDLAEEASLRALVKKQILASSLSASDQGACFALLCLLPLYTLLTRFHMFLQ